MCGIIGLISKNGSFPYFADDLFTNLLRMDSVRGDDSTGVFGVSKDGHCDVVKGNADGYLFTRTQDYNDFLNRMGKHYRIVIGHNRAATTGAITAENAHPFREKHIVLVHNGTINNKEKLNSEVEVDSHAICHALAENDAVEALGKIDGAYALVWYNKLQKTLNIARNDKRPLFLIEYDQIWVISSEVGLPYWLNRRQDRKEKDQGIRMVPTEKIMVMKLDAIHKGWSEVNYEEYKFWKGPSVVETHYPPIHHSRYNPEPSTPPFKQRENIVDLTAHQPKKKYDGVIKPGQQITFVLTDSAMEDKSEVMIGHPVFDDEMDQNIIVRAVLPQNITFEEIYKLVEDGGKYTATVQAFRTLSSIPVIYVRDPKLVEEIRDASGNVSDSGGLEEACKNDGCGKCKQPMTVEEAKKGIARKRKDNKWRLVCPSCLETSINEVRQNKPNVKLRAANAS